MRRGIAIGTGLALLLAAVAYGQAERSPATLDDLLVEMRGLRTDLGQQSSATLRTQSLATPDRPPCCRVPVSFHSTVPQER